MFIPRHPVVENQFCSYEAQTGTSTAGVGGVICYAGAVLYLVTNDGTENPNDEALVLRYDTKTDYDALETSEQTPFGFSMQKVKTGYHQVHPAGFMMPGDLGSSDVIAQPSYDASGNITGTKAAPLGVSHLGIWDTVHYTCAHTAGAADVATGAHMKPGDSLFTGANCGARVTNSTTAATNDDDDGDRLNSTIVGKVVKGASADKCNANIGNTTLYPIRIKLLI